MDVCRLCARASTDSVTISSERQGDSISGMVHLVTAVAIAEGDGLPRIVCLDCVELTIDAFNYVKRVREADELFRKSIAESELTHLDGELQRESTAIPKDVSLMDQCSSEVVEIDIIDQKEEDCETLLEFEVVPVEYSSSDLEATSSKLIGLLIESIHDPDVEKWHKLKQDPNFVEVFEIDDIQLDESSDDEEYNYVESEPATHKQKQQQVVRCCSRRCNQWFYTREELLEHGFKVHGEDLATIHDPSSPFQCVVCYQRFETRRKLTGHLRRLIRDYRCQLCDIYFNAPRDKLIHMKDKHDEMSRSTVPYYRLEDQPVKICCGCESTFDTVEELFQHGADQHQRIENVPEDRNFQCNICCKYFKSKASLRNHQLLVYKPKTFSCESCQKAFECPSKLAIHKTTHRTERNFACSVCQGTFKTATDLRAHQRIHQEKNFECSVCRVRFHKQAHLKSHLKTHDITGGFEYSCTECGKQFREKSNWKNHLRVHTKEKPYKCDHCSKEFRYAVDRKRHEMKHTGNYPHVCSTCKKSFARTTQLQNHMRKCLIKKK